MRILLDIIDNLFFYFFFCLFLCVFFFFFFLQKFHHFGAVWSWFLLLYVDSASVLIATLYNSLVHTFMYFYYFLSVFDKDKILLPFKPVMTSLQHLQLAYGFYAILFDYVIKHYEGTILDAYTIPNSISLLYGLCLNLLFLHFSFVNYLSQKKSERPTHSFFFFSSYFPG